MSASTNQIFISYRREDSAAITGRIYDRLVQKFGREAIFKDVDSIPLGVNYRKHLDSIVSECDVVLVVIGDKWLEVISDSGQRRLDDPRDFVRIEIESALKRNIPVIPLLIQDVELPPEDSLPESLQELSYRNGLSVGLDPHFHADVSRLISGLEAMLGHISARKASEEVTGSKVRAAESSVPAPDTSPAQEEKETVQPSPDAAYPSMFSRRNMSPQEAIKAERQLRWISYALAPLLGIVVPIPIGVLCGSVAASVFKAISMDGAVLRTSGYRDVFSASVAFMTMVWTLGVVGWLCGALRPLVNWKVGLWLSAPLCVLGLSGLLIFLAETNRPYFPDDLTVFTFALITLPLMPLFACGGIYVGKLYAARRRRR